MTFNDDLQQNLTHFFVKKDKPYGIETLDQTRVYLEMVSFDGLEEFHHYSSNEKLYEYFEFDVFKSVEDTKSYLQKLIKRMEPDENGFRDSVYFFVRNKLTHKLIGTANLAELNTQRQSVCWGYAIDPEEWGSGYVFEVQNILKYFVFEVLKLNRLSGVTDVNNERNIRSILAANMQKEGVLRQYYLYPDGYQDALVYAMTSNDYFAENSVKHNYQEHQSGLNKEISVDDVINVIGTVLRDTNLTEDTSMYNCDLWDSLTHMDILSSLADNFNIQLSSTNLDKMVSVKSIQEYLNAPR